MKKTGNTNKKITPKNKQNKNETCANAVKNQSFAANKEVAGNPIVVRVVKNKQENNSGASPAKPATSVRSREP
jgi:hypothetical protein